MNSHSKLPAAVLWDMDGTLIDSEPYWVEAETELAARFGVAWTHEDGLALVGNPLTVSAEALRARGVDLPADQVVEALLERVTARVRAHIPWQADARALLDQVVAAGIPCALVTMSYRILADAMLDTVLGIFSVVVTGEDVENGKPHPEPYLAAAALLGVAATDCIAVEDSPSGVASAHASGAATIAVRRVVPVATLPGLSRVRSLDGVGIGDLVSIVNGKVLDTLGEEPANPEQR